MDREGLSSTTRTHVMPNIIERALSVILALVLQEGGGNRRRAKSVEANCMYIRQQGKVTVINEIEGADEQSKLSYDLYASRGIHMLYIHAHIQEIIIKE